MSTPNQLTRDSRISDDAMLEDGRITHAQFALDEAASLD